MSDLQDGLSWVAVMASLRDSWVSLVIWSALRSGGRPLGWRHHEDGVEARMSMAWLPGCGRHMCPKAPRLSLWIIVVSKPFTYQDKNDTVGRWMQRASRF